MQFQGFAWLRVHVMLATTSFTKKMSSGCSCKTKSARSSNISFFFFSNKTIIPLVLVGYETIILSIISYPTRGRGITISYFAPSLDPIW